MTNHISTFELSLHFQEILAIWLTISPSFYHLSFFRTYSQYDWTYLQFWTISSFLKKYLLYDLSSLHFWTISPFFRNTCNMTKHLSMAGWQNLIPQALISSPSSYWSRPLDWKVIRKHGQSFFSSFIIMFCCVFFFTLFLHSRMRSHNLSSVFIGDWFCITKLRGDKET